MSTNSAIAAGHNFTYKLTSEMKLLDYSNESNCRVGLYWGKARLTALLVIMICCTFISVADGQTNQQPTGEFRPFKPIVDAIAQKSLQEQCEYLVRLSKGLMAEDYAIFTRQRNYPHFGHLAKELLVQKKFDLMRAMLRGDDLESYDFFTLAELLAQKNDPEAFEILIKHSSISTPPPKGDEGIKTPEGLVAGEGIPDYAALSLGHYLTNAEFQARAQAHLIKILKEHQRTGVRAFAAEALGYCGDPVTIKALESATNDMGTVPCVQCGEDNVRDYAVKALKRIKARNKP